MLLRKIPVSRYCFHFAFFRITVDKLLYRLVLIKSVFKQLKSLGSPGDVFAVRGCTLPVNLRKSGFILFGYWLNFKTQLSI